MSDTADRTPTKPGLGPLPKDALADPAASLQRAWGWLLALGILLILGGTAAFLAPVAASIAVELVVGAVMLVSGGLQLWQTLGCADWRGRAWSVVSGLVYLVGGVLLLANPLAGVVALTIVMIATLMVDGIFRIALGFRMRPERGWGWIAFGGALTVALAGLLLALFGPELSLTLIGLFVAVSLIVEGWGVVFLAVAARRAARRADD